MIHRKTKPIVEKYKKVCVIYQGKRVIKKIFDNGIPQKNVLGIPIYQIQLLLY